ncbi:MAG: LamG domain-containing protein, partial [Polyangiaceae bacterium]
AGCGIVCSAPDGLSPACSDSACVDYDPTCADGVKNGDEEGLDCGGSCPACEPVCFLGNAAPLHYWPADGAALDIIATAHGTLAGNTTYGAGKVDQAFVFDGNGDTVTFASPTSFGTADFTVDFWVKTTATRGEGVVGRRPVCAHSNMFDVRMGNGYIGVELDDGNVNYNALTTSKQVNDGLYHHVAIARKGVKLSIFVDGELDVEKSTLAVTNINNPGNLVAGASACTNQDGTHFFTGALDELRVWGRALPAAEVAQIFAAGSAGICKSGPLTCPTGYDDCDGFDGNGCETSLNTDPESCGACGETCALPHAVAGCAAAACTVSACDEGWADCDGDPANGCEVNVLTSDANCGACGVACGAGTDGCSGGVCRCPASATAAPQDNFEQGVDCRGPCAACEACFASGPPAHHWPADRTLADSGRRGQQLRDCHLRRRREGRGLLVGPAITLPPRCPRGRGDFTIEAWIRTTSGSRMIVLSREATAGAAEVPIGSGRGAAT